MVHHRHDLLVTIVGTQHDAITLYCEPASTGVVTQPVLEPAVSVKAEKPFGAFLPPNGP